MLRFFSLGSECLCLYFTTLICYCMGGIGYHFDDWLEIGIMSFFLGFVIEPGILLIEWRYWCGSPILIRNYIIENLYSGHKTILHLQYTTSLSSRQTSTELMLSFYPRTNMDLKTMRFVSPDIKCLNFSYIVWLPMDGEVCDNNNLMECGQFSFVD